MRDRIAKALRRQAPPAGDAAVSATPCLGCQDKVGRPLPVAPVAGRTAGPDDVVVPVPDTLSAVADGHLVVFAPHLGRAVLLNASAALIYTAFDGARTVREVVAQLADETGMDAALLASDVRATVDRLLAQRLLALATEELPDAADPATPTEEPAEPAARRAEVDEHLRTIAWVADSGPRRIAGTSVVVRSDDAEVGELLDRLLAAHVSAPGTAAEAAHQIGIVTRPGSAGESALDRADERALQPGPERQHHVVLDGRVVDGGTTPAFSVVAALHHLDLLAVDGSAGLLRFHAGAVERDGRVVLIVGSSGKGKSTLTAALVQHGFRYLSDEVGAVDPTAFRVLPHAKALDLDAAAIELLGLDGADVSLGSHKDKVLPTRLGELSEGGQVALLVFLAETFAEPPQRGAAPVEGVPPAEALVALLPVTFEQTVSDPTHFDAMAALCERTPAIRIGRAPLAATIAAIEAALAP